MTIKGEELHPHRKAVTKAKPYNSPAKVIEGTFAALERHLSRLDGYIGEDRMNKKTHSVGKPAKPFPGTAEELCRKILETIKIYNARPQGARGALKGRSPNQVYFAAREGALARAEERKRRMHEGGNLRAS